VRSLCRKVRIEVAPSQTPEETLAKASQLRAAATAPSDPSHEDDAVAAEASQMELAALQDIAEARSAEQAAPTKSASLGQASSGPFRGFSAAA
jgi:hypothetical protein